MADLDAEPGGFKRTNAAYIVAYRDTQFPRNRGNIEALHLLDDIDLYEACNHTPGLRRYLESYRQLAAICAKRQPELLLFGFRSHEFFWPFVWRFAKGSNVVFDALMSPSASLQEEGKAGAIGRWLAPIIGLLERSILRRADIVLTDTASHASYLAQRFELSAAKVVAVPVSTPYTAKPSTPPVADGEFSVLFFGSVLPLHGIPVIIEAASKLSQLPIRFDFVGGKKEVFARWCGMAGVTRYTHHAYVPFVELVEKMIPAATLCLGGPFGGTPQARRVITTKTTLCLAAAKPTVVGRTDVNEGFDHGKNCLIVEQNDAADLVDKILWAYQNRDKLQSIGTQGRALYDRQFSIEVLSLRLQTALNILRQQKKYEYETATR